MLCAFVLGFGCLGGLVCLGLFDFGFGVGGLMRYGLGLLLGVV